MPARRRRFRPRSCLSIGRQAVASRRRRAGRKLFGADALGCVKCHAIVPGQASAGGPSLAEAAKRFTAAHLVESVLLPSKQIAPVFRACATRNDRRSRRNGAWSWARPTTGWNCCCPTPRRKTFAKTDIAERHPSDISAMPAGLVKTPDELRDLLAYLLSENPQAP